MIFINKKSDIEILLFILLLESKLKFVNKFGLFRKLIGLKFK